MRDDFILDATRIRRLCREARRMVDVVTAMQGSDAEPGEWEERCLLVFAIAETLREALDDVTC